MVNRRYLTFLRYLLTQGGNLMALGILGIIYQIIIAVFAAVIFSLFFKDGKYMSNKWTFTLAQMFLAVIAFLLTTGLPDNYIGQRVIGWLVVAAAIFNVWFKNKNFKIARIVTVVTIVVELFMMFY